ncbi:VOC family protein [Agrobacterium sp. AGB01]|uniref:VOC family protein n=1 Tax=Agrobacterium sp. AGB01 TaxID=2769302 RepID=UPI001782309A|nr:VOC family protein [Agrobacterium sp. AGB01]MBD9386237.1 VOC family protein [Agrobacterium sp. AGB01]
MNLSRRHILKLAGVTSASAALAGAVKAEGMTNLTLSTDAMPFALTTPMHIREAAIRVKNLDNMLAYYRQVMGFTEIARNGNTVIVGAGGTALLHLIHMPEAEFESQSAAGLFHIAYLMPTRKDLARWLVHVARMQAPVTGFADHNVSEAVYLNDPEGNGIEVYSDRQKDSWQWDGDVVTMGTKELDIDDIVALTDTTKDDYTIAPDNLRIGHMHLRVGDIAKGRAFYENAVGLASTRGNREDAAFLSSGRYHHHVAINTWNSRGAELRDDKQTGLAWFSLTITDAADIKQQQARLEAAGYKISQLENGDVEAVDPWGTGLRLQKA